MGRNVQGKGKKFWQDYCSLLGGCRDLQKFSFLAFVLNVCSDQWREAKFSST